MLKKFLQKLGRAAAAAAVASLVLAFVVPFALNLAAAVVGGPLVKYGVALVGGLAVGVYAFLNEDKAQALIDQFQSQVKKL